MRVRVKRMTTTTNEEFTAFTQEDVVYDDGCSECEKETGAPLAFVEREDPENVIHESCLFALKPREREAFIRIKDVPSGKPTAAEKVDAMIGESLDADDEEYQLDEPVEYHTEEVQVPKGQKIINIEFGEE